MWVQICFYPDGFTCGCEKKVLPIFLLCDAFVGKYVNLENAVKFYANMFV